MSTKTMKAVIFDGPGKVSIQDRPVPQRELEKHPHTTNPHLPFRRHGARKKEASHMARIEHRDSCLVMFFIISS